MHDFFCTLDCSFCLKIVCSVIDDLFSLFVYLNEIGNWCSTALDFIDDDAIDDAWVVMSYLSDADCLLAGSPITSARLIVNESNESDSMSQLIAASVAARGVLFGNAHASPSRYLLINTIFYLKNSELIIFCSDLS
jgi:hypothetical protein